MWESLMVMDLFIYFFKKIVVDPRNMLDIHFFYISFINQQLNM
jgi:hypothetical protein